jgi:hypothetical protein
MVKKVSYSKIVKVGFLLTVLLFPSFAKTFHSSYETLCYSETPAHPDNTPARHDADDCPICQFQFTSYTGTEFLALDFVPQYHSFETFLSNEKEYLSPLFSYFLRGPPLSN